MAVEHTFVVLAYGESPYLDECVQSLCAQQQASRIIVATSTPNDHIRSIAKKYNVDLAVNALRNGIAEDWNFAYTQCNTKYLTLAHQDDVYLPAYTEKLLTTSSKHNNLLIAFCDYAELRAGEVVESNSLLRIKRAILDTFYLGSDVIHSSFWKKRMLGFGSPISCPGVWYNTHLIGKDFHFLADFRINMDWDAWYRLATMRGSFVREEAILFQHRIYQESATSLGLASNHRQNEDAAMFRRFWPSWIVSMMMKLYARSYRSNEV